MTAHSRFLRDLDEFARKHALATGEAFAAIVRDEIDKHQDHIHELSKQADEAHDKAAGTQAKTGSR